MWVALSVVLIISVFWIIIFSLVYQDPYNWDGHICEFELTNSEFGIRKVEEFNDGLDGPGPIGNIKFLDKTYKCKKCGKVIVKSKEYNL